MKIVNINKLCYYTNTFYIPLECPGTRIRTHSPPQGLELTRASESWLAAGLDCFVSHWYSKGCLIFQCVILRKENTFVQFSTNET